LGPIHSTSSGSPTHYKLGRTQPGLRQQVGRRSDERRWFDGYVVVVGRRSVGRRQFDGYVVVVERRSVGRLKRPSQQKRPTLKLNKIVVQYIKNSFIN
jgi:hypothetical protein